MMKRFLLLFVIAATFAACNTSEKLMRQGNYDAAVNYSVRKLQKSPSNKKSIMVLEKSYPAANERNLERIKFLKLDGNPDVYDEVFQIYVNMKARQNLVKTVLPLNLEGRSIDFPVVDYDQEIINAKMRAANYFYNHAKELMDKNDRKSNREAYYELQKIKTYYANYEDADDLAKEAKFRGTSKALVSVVNQTIYKLSPEFVNNIISFGTQQLDQEWINYYTSKPTQNITLDFLVNINLKIIDISPEKIKEEKREETKKIQDGYEYELDAKGNVKKDSLGNDIKKPKYKIIVARVMESRQEKSCHMEGTIDYINTQNNQIVRTIPISADNFFRYSCVTANGDLNALTPETKQSLGRKPVPFPADVDMIQATNESLRNSVRNALRANSKYLDY